MLSTQYLTHSNDSDGDSSNDDTADTCIGPATHHSTQHSVSGGSCWTRVFLFFGAGSTGRRGRNTVRELYCICNCINSEGMRVIGVLGEWGVVDL